MKYMKTFLALAFAFMFISADKDSFIITGKVESIRNDGYITVLFDSEASESEYLLLNENKFIGKRSNNYETYSFARSRTGNKTPG